MAAPPTRPRAPRWRDSPERAELRSLYEQADALLRGWTCACSGDRGAAEARCCHFAVTGREPYPTAVELEEVRHALRASPPAKGPRRLPLVELGPCPLLAIDGRCSIYASRPLGCRTFFCDDAGGPAGSRARLPRDGLGAIARRVADLSARFSPRDPHPRPLTRALARLARPGGRD